MTRRRLTVSQGRLPSESGAPGDIGIAGGQVAVTFDNFATNQDEILANTLSPGTDDSFGQQFSGFSGGIPIGTTDATTFQIPVNITNTATVDSLDVTVNIVDAQDQYLGLMLVAPSGATFTLILNQVPVVKGMADTGIGISGANVGVVTYTNNNIFSYAVGTTFDDNATRNIFNTTTTGTNGNAAPYIGEFQAEETLDTGETLDEFVSSQLKTAAGINGTWILETKDTDANAPSSPQYVINWSLSFGHGLNADTYVAIPAAVVGDLYVATPLTGSVTPANAVAGELTVPSSAVQIGPGLVMAQGQHTGRLQSLRGPDLCRVCRLYQRQNRWVHEPDEQHRHLSHILRRWRPELEHASRGQRRLEPVRRLYRRERDQS